MIKEHTTLKHRFKTTPTLRPLHY